MGAYHARELRPTATVYPEVTRCRVATVKLSRRRYLKKRPRIAVFCPLCVPHHRVLAGESALAAVHERNKQEKSLPKKAAQERTHKREDRHTRNNKEGSPKHNDQPAPGDPDWDRERFGVLTFLPFSSASLFAVGIHSEVLMPRVDDHRDQPQCQYSSCEDHLRD